MVTRISRVPSGSGATIIDLYEGGEMKKPFLLTEKQRLNLARLCDMKECVKDMFYSFRPIGKERISVLLSLNEDVTRNEISYGQYGDIRCYEGGLPIEIASAVDKMLIDHARRLAATHHNKERDLQEHLEQYLGRV